MRRSKFLLFTVAIMGAAGFAGRAVAEGTGSSGIISSVSRTATMSTGNMPPGSEMWALWVSLPPGQKIEVTEAKVPSTWMDLETTITGSTTSALLPGSTAGNQCLFLGTEGPANFTGQQVTIRQGEGFACDFGTGGSYWEENRGADLYARAQLNVGGPWVPGMYDAIDTYRSAGGDSKALRVDAISFRPVEKELRAAGMMTATTRIVTMPPGTKGSAEDRYPTLRMLTRGELKWGAGPVDIDAPELKSVFKLAPFNWIEWTRPQRVVLSNETSAPAEYIEWSVIPAPASHP